MCRLKRSHYKRSRWVRFLCVLCRQPVALPSGLFFIQLEHAQLQVPSHFLTGCCQGRPTGGINEEKAVYAKEMPHITGLEEICRAVKPTVAIGMPVCIASN